MVDNQSSYVRIRSGGVTYALCLVPSGQGPAGCPKVRRGGVTYDVYTVSTVDQYASPVRVHFAGSTKAVRFYTEHEDVAHVDASYQDVAHQDFMDYAHGDFTDSHSNVAHVDSHLNYSDNTNVHIDADEAPIPWMNHSNVPHTDNAHYNVPFQNVPHTDNPHSDFIPWMHMDFTDTHPRPITTTRTTPSLILTIMTLLFGLIHILILTTTVTWTTRTYHTGRGPPEHTIQWTTLMFFTLTLTILARFSSNYTDSIHSDYVDSQSFPISYQDHSNSYSDVAHTDTYHSDVASPHSDHTDSHGDNVAHSDAETVPTFKSQPAK